MSVLRKIQITAICVLYIIHVILQLSTLMLRLIINYVKSIDYEKSNSYVRGSGCDLQLWRGKEV